MLSFSPTKFLCQQPKFCLPLLRVSSSFWLSFLSSSPLFSFLLCPSTLSITPLISYCVAEWWKSVMRWMRRGLPLLGFKAWFFHLCPLDLKILFLLIFPAGVTVRLLFALVEGILAKVPKGLIARIKGHFSWRSFRSSSRILLVHARRLFLPCLLLLRPSLQSEYRQHLQAGGQEFHIY